MLGRLTVVLGALGALASAQLSVVEYLIPRANAFPHDPAVAADGMVFYTDQQNSYIGRLDPTTGAIVDWPTPTPGSGPHGITVAPDGYVWYTGQSTGRLGRVHPVTGQITEFVLPANASQPHTPIAHQGRIWFTCQGNQTYGRLDPANGMVQVFPAPAGSNPYGICPAPDGYLWIALFGTNRLGRVDPVSGALQLFPLPNAGARPRRLTVTNDGFVWYTDFARGFLGRLDPSNGQVVEWAAPDTPPGPYGISTGTDGRLWFHAQGSNYMIAFDRQTTMFQTVPIPTGGAIVRHMVTDWTRGRLWLALSGTRRIGKVQLAVPLTPYGSACAGAAGLPEIAVAGVPRIGNTLTCTVTNTTAPVGVFFLGLSNTLWNGLALPYDLLPFGSGGCFVNASVDAILYQGPLIPVPVPIPLLTALNGITVYVQWALLGDPSGRLIVTTQGVAVLLIGS